MLYDDPEPVRLKGGQEGPVIGGILHFYQLMCLLTYFIQLLLGRQSCNVGLGVFCMHHVL